MPLIMHPVHLQLPLLHSSPDAHDLHEPPPDPHALVLLPLLQVPPSMHPLQPQLPAPEHVPPDGHGVDAPSLKQPGAASEHAL